MGYSSGDFIFLANFIHRVSISECNHRFSVLEGRQRALPSPLHGKMATQSTNIVGIRPGFKGYFDAVVVRKWSNYIAENRLMSTDYILSDTEKNVIHCTTRSDIAHIFSKCLKVGVHARFGLVDVLPNLENYRVVRKPRYMLELTGMSEVRVLPNITTQVDFPFFDLTPLGEVVSDDNYTLIDVVGRVNGVKDLITRPTSTTYNTKKESRSIDFTLHDAEDGKVRVTLWDSLVDEFLQQKPQDERSWIIGLVAMNPRPFRDMMCISSTSATQIYSAEHIKEIDALRNQIGNKIIDSCPPESMTLAALAEWNRLNKPPTNFNIKASISDIDPKRGWYYLACTTPRCFKKVNPTDTGYKCPKCNVKIEESALMYKIKASVHDEASHSMVTMLDVPGEQLLGISATSLVAAMESEGVVGGVPPALTTLVNTAHVMEISSKPYMEQGAVTHVCRKIVSFVEPRPMGPTPGADYTSTTLSLAPPSNKTPKKKEQTRVKAQEGNTQVDPKCKKPRVLERLDDDDVDEVTSARLSSA